MQLTYYTLRFRIFELRNKLEMPVQEIKQEGFGTHFHLAFSRTSKSSLICCHKLRCYFRSLFTFQIALVSSFECYNNRFYKWIFHDENRLGTVASALVELYRCSLHTDFRGVGVSETAPSSVSKITRNLSVSCLFEPTCLNGPLGKSARGRDKKFT